MIKLRNSVWVGFRVWHHVGERDKYAVNLSIMIHG